ncbi:probable WRKY transcription factor 4 [Malania oleifera]|uniref:probable WRKY transcription factor 4 n=1 Tax=Malania oleifera TaxID=397392 RepID=UPI0025AE8C18|nr:probable WRKY transcription factor 4 [Malania oleifera]
MAENDVASPSFLATSMASSSSPPPPVPPSSRPTITLPPRSSMETLFTGGLGASPGPMTLVSSFFADNDPDSDCRSFSQLLAGAMASPPAQKPPPLPPPYSAQGSSKEKKSSGDDADADFRFKQNRPTGLMISQPPVFTVPPGLSPATLLDSPALFSGGQGPFGMSHQQALAQVTAQAAQANYMHVQADYTSSLSTAPSTSMMQVLSFASSTTTHQQMPSIASDPTSEMKELSEFSQSDQKSQPTSFTVDKPANDGYNWRKYGQKQVKGSEYPRSYYKCTHPNCPVKKKVERSLDGQITEIIYKGQHNHQPPQTNKRLKDTRNVNGHSNYQASSELVSQVQTKNLNKSKEDVAAASSVSKMDQEFSQATPEQLSGSSDNEEVADNETRVEERDEDEPDSKRRNMEGRVSEPACSHRTVTEPRIIVQTTSEVDLLDDGYRWRKYGQKVVKGNPYPRSYYKCTTPGCNVRKHVERAATDHKAVITTYEGKHNHDVPMAKNSSHNTANSNASRLRPPSLVPDKNALIDKKADIWSNGQQPLALAQLKEEQPI